MVYGRLTISSTSLFVVLTLAISCHLHHDPDCLANVNGLQVLPVRARHRHGEGTTLHECTVLGPFTYPATARRQHSKKLPITNVSRTACKLHEASSRHAPERLAYTLVPNNGDRDCGTPTLGECQRSWGIDDSDVHVERARQERELVKLEMRHTFLQRRHRDASISCSPVRAGALVAIDVDPKHGVGHSRALRSEFTW